MSSKSVEELYGTVVIARTRNAGVHCGTLVRVDPITVRLENSRRMWRWHSKFTLSEASVEGIDHAQSRIACTVPDLVLFTADVCELIPVSEVAAKSILEAPSA